MTFWLRQLLTVILFVINIGIVLAVRWFTTDVLHQDYDLTLGLAIFALWIASSEGAHRVLRSPEVRDGD